MDTCECIRKRRDIRSFIYKEVPEDVIMKIVEAGRLAPSAMNLQPWDFIIIKDNQTIGALGPICTSGRFVVDASFAVVVVTDPSNKWHEIDGARAVQNMALAGWNEGVGCCWIGAINRERVKEMLNIPQKLHVLTILPFGYPEQFTVKRKKNRKAPGEIVHREKFGVKL
ncbi:MAG: nitroreductase family protein [Thermodesulfobacteriota bacterium]